MKCEKCGSKNIDAFIGKCNECGHIFPYLPEAKRFKQHIEVNQLQELTEEQQQRLRAWLASKAMTEVLPDLSMIQLSIGQMIELLNEKAIAVDIKTTNMDTADGNKAYLLIHNFLDTKACNSTELADALWSAVKEVL